MKHLKTFENYNDDYNDDNNIPIGTKIKTSMGISRTGIVIPWFYYKEATDGTYSEPDRDNYIAVQWDDDTKGFNAISNSVIIKDDNTEEHLGRLLTDEEYDESPGGVMKIHWNESKESGTIEFEDGSIDDFIIYNSGKISFSNWYPKEKAQKLMSFIRVEKEASEFD